MQPGERELHLRLHARRPHHPAALQPARPGSPAAPSCPRPARRAPPAPGSHQPGQPRPGRPARSPRGPGPATVHVLAREKRHAQASENPRPSAQVPRTTPSPGRWHRQEQRHIAARATTCHDQLARPDRSRGPPSWGQASAPMRPSGRTAEPGRGARCLQKPISREPRPRNPCPVGHIRPGAWSDDVPPVPLRPALAQSWPVADRCSGQGLHGRESHVASASVEQSAHHHRAGHGWCPVRRTKEDGHDGRREAGTRQHDR